MKAFMRRVLIALVCLAAVLACFSLYLSVGVLLMCIWLSLVGVGEQVHPIEYVALFCVGGFGPGALLGLFINAREWLESRRKT